MMLLIRLRMQEAGTIARKGCTFTVDNGQQPTTPDGKRNKSYKVQKIEVAKGDRLICLKNDRKAGLYNNMEGTVQSIDKDGRAKILTKDGTITANLKENPSWDYAYAKTVNKLQGATVDTIITIEDRSNRNAHFVAVSRARTEGVIFTTNRQRLEKAADEWANKVTADSFRPPTTEKGEYRTKEERAALIRGIREPSGIEIEKLKEQEKYLGHPLQLEDMRSHAEPEFVLLQNMDEEKELLNAYEQLGKNKLPFEIDRATINNESVAIDKNGKEYLFPASKLGELPANGKEMAQQLANDFATLRQAAQNPGGPGPQARRGGAARHHPGKQRSGDRGFVAVRLFHRELAAGPPGGGGADGAAAGVLHLRNRRIGRKERVHPHPGR